MGRPKKVSTEVTPAPAVTTEAQAPKAALTDQQVALGATNNPALSSDSFTLGDKTYKYVHLSYDYYVEFMFKVKPLLSAVIGVIASKAESTVSLPGIELMADPTVGLTQFCSAEIPDMVRIIVNNTLEAEFGEDAVKVTAKDIKKIKGVTPFTLTNIVMGQVVMNNLIAEFGSFFVQSLPILKAVGILTPNHQPR